jgi:hypothetical protein
MQIVFCLNNHTKQVNVHAVSNHSLFNIKLGDTYSNQFSMNL